MPRYRFQWEVIPAPVLQALCRDLAITGQPADELRRYFGARPKENFVESCWPTLLEAWLSNDQRSRQFVVGELRERALGDMSCDISTAAGELAYLKTCRNSKTLRDLVLAAFHEIGEPAGPSASELVRSGAQSRAAEAPGEGTPPVAPAPASAQEAQAADEKHESLAEWLLATLRRELKLPKLEVDQDGDIPLIRGSSVTFLRAVENPKEPPFVHIFAPMLQGLEQKPEVLDAINTINLQIEVARALLTKDGTAILAADLPAMSIGSETLMFTVDLVTGAADHFDTLLKDRFGGKTMRPDDAEEGVDV